MTAPPTGLWGRLVSYAVAAAFTGLIIWMVKSPIFAVRAVDVHRADSSPPPVIDPRKIEDVVARLARGANIFRLNAGALRTAVRAQPGVADAIVAVTLDGRVTVTVSYQAPVANWVVAGQSYVVSADGHVLAARYQPDLQLTVEDTSDGTVAPGATVSADALHAAYQLQNNLPFLRVVPTRFRYAPNSLLVIDHSGREILFGSTDRLAAKLVALQAVLEEAGRRGERVASVDLRPIDRPTYRTVDAPPLKTTLDFDLPPTIPNVPGLDLHAPAIERTSPPGARVVTPPSAGARAPP